MGTGAAAVSFLERSWRGAQPLALALKVLFRNGNTPLRHRFHGRLYSLSLLRQRFYILFSTMIQTHFADLWTFEFASLRICGTANLRVCESASLRVFEFASLRMCESANLRVCEFADQRVCEFASLRTCEFADLWMYLILDNFDARVFEIYRLRIC